MRIVFAGTPQPAVPSLLALVDAGHEVPLVITRPDAPIGRRRVLTPSPVAAAGLELGLAVHRTARLDEEALTAVREAQPDLGVIVAYGGLVREPLLSTPRHGWINLHFSVLPRWRGAAPVQHAIIAGDPEVGADVFQLTHGLDEGDICGEIRFPRPADATAGDLLATLAESGAELLAAVVGEIADGTARPRPQQGEPTYAPKLSIEDGRVDWEQPREQVVSRIERECSRGEVSDSVLPFCHRSQTSGLCHCNWDVESFWNRIGRLSSIPRQGVTPVKSCRRSVGKSVCHLTFV